MQVILLQDIRKIGKAGEIKKVADGHARNLLIPQGLAKPATKDALRAYKASQDNKKRSQDKEVEQARDLAKKLQGHVLVLQVNANGDKLFGSVGEKEVSEALKRDGYAVVPECVHMKKHVKEVGKVSIKVSFGYDITATIDLDIQKK